MSVFVIENALSTLFEPSSTLRDKLAPEINQFISINADSGSSTSYTYSDLVDIALSLICRWDIQSKAQFIHAHPRIGQVTNLSAHSEKEQASIETSADVLARLVELNALYERRYPGLRYITFVNGRTRAQIKDEMEARLAIDHSWPGQKSLDDVPSISVGSPEWIAELERAIIDIGLIAKSRANAMGCKMIQC